MARCADVGVRSVLVPEAHALGMLAAIRSLGRAGYRVHAASPHVDAIGFASRHCTAKVVCPPLSGPAYTEWLQRYIAEQAIDAVVPGGAFLLAIEPCFESYQNLLPIAQDRDIVYRALSKTEVFEAFRAAPRELGLLQHHPPSLVAHRDAPRPSLEEIAALGKRIFLKADARHGGIGAEDFLAGPFTSASADQELRRVLVQHRKALLQGEVGGRQAGVTLLMSETGQVLACNCVLDMHEEPTRSGTMSLRSSWHSPELIEDAVRRLRHLGWQGAAMLEYRVRDSDGSFDFIELNPRYWQSLHLDLLCGIDFPKLQMAWFEGGQITPPLPRRVVCGDLWPGEISRQLEIWRSGHFPPGRRIRETSAFLLRLLDPRIASDYAFPGDRMVYCHRVVQTLRGWLRRRS